MKLKLLLILVLMILFTGCTSYTELNDLSIVNTLGIDYKDNKYILYVNVVEGKIDDGEIEKNFKTFISPEETLEEAFKKIYLTSEKKLYLSHIDLLILTEDVINSHMKDIINNFLEDNEYRNNFNVILFKSSMEDLFNSEITSTNINNLIKTNQKETGILKTKDLETIMKELLIDTNTYIPTIELDNKKASILGYTLIQNYKIFGELTEEESTILNLLNNNIEKAYLNNHNIFDNETIISTNKNKITFRFIITIDKKENFIKDTREDIINFLNKYSDYDILKLKEIIRRNDYKYYKKTKDLMSKLKYNIKFQIKEKERYIK